MSSTAIRKNVFGTCNFFVTVVVIALLAAVSGCAVNQTQANDPTLVKGAKAVYYYTARGKLIYVEDMSKIPERKLHKLRGHSNDTPFNFLMSQCGELPKLPSHESQLDVMSGPHGIPASAIYISQTQVLAYEDLTGLPSRIIIALQPQENFLSPEDRPMGACKPTCFCPPCSNPPTGYSCCCPPSCRQ